MSSESKCASCDREDTVPWTVTQGGSVTLVDLCPTHDKFLRDFVSSVTGRQPPKRQPTSRQLGVANRNKVKLRPLDWTPPN